MQILSHGHAAHRTVAPPLRRVFVGRYECLDTGRVVIGQALALNPKPPVATRDGETLQEALLQPLTLHKPGALARMAGALWSKA